MRKFWNGFLLYPPDSGSGSGSGSAENGGAPGTDASVTSGSASESLIAAALASESSAGGTTTESEAAKVAKATGIDISGDTTGAGTKVGVATSDATGQQPPVGTGEAPPNRIEAAVKNARAAATSEVEAKYAWAKDLDQEAVTTSIGLVRSMLSDPQKFLRTLAAQEGFQIVPAGEKPGAVDKPAPKPFTLPVAALRSEDGKGAFSSDQVAEILKDFAADLEAKFGGQLKPLLSAREEDEKAASEAAERANVTQTVTETMADLRARPFFQVEDKDGKKVDSPKIMEYLLAIPQRVRVANPIAALHRAYATYMEKDILPNYGKISEQRIRDENAKKAAASGGARPGAGTGVGDTTPKPIRGVNDLAAKMEQMYAAASSGA